MLIGPWFLLNNFGSKVPRATKLGVCGLAMEGAEMDGAHGHAHRHVYNHHMYGPTGTHTPNVWDHGHAHTKTGPRALCTSNNNNNKYEPTTFYTHLTSSNSSYRLHSSIQVL